MPATLQAAIAARIDRLDAGRKAHPERRIGDRLAIRRRAAGNADRRDRPYRNLIQAELIDQIKFTPKAEYVISASADPHGGLRIATQVRSRRPAPKSWPPRSNGAILIPRMQNAALIAEHTEAAGDLAAAYGWHMRAGTWAVNRDIAAAHTSWSKARDAADRMPESMSDRLAMRIAPRTILCASSFRVGGSGAETGYDELRELCEQAGDKRSLAIGMTGLVGNKVMAHSEECIPLAAEHLRLLESIGDPELTVGLQIATFAAKSQAGEGSGASGVGGACHQPCRRRCHQREHDLRVTAGDGAHLSRHRTVVSADFPAGRTISTAA